MKGKALRLRLTSYRNKNGKLVESDLSLQVYSEHLFVKEKKKLTDIGLDRLAFIRSLEIIYWTVTRTLDVLRLPIRINQLLIQK